MKTLNLSSDRYRVTWVEFRPESGIATKADIRKLDSFVPHYGRACDIHTGCHYKWFARKADAVNFLKNFSKKLSKRYECRLFTDKQFGDRNEKDGHKVHFTKRQESEVYYI